MNSKLQKLREIAINKIKRQLAIGRSAPNTKKVTHRSNNTEIKKLNKEAVKQKPTKKINISKAKQIRNGFKGEAAFAQNPQKITTYRQADELLLEYSKIAARQLQIKQQILQIKFKHTSQNRTTVN